MNYSNKTHQIYVHKVVSHDITHQYSVNSEIIDNFFERLDSITIYRADDENFNNPYNVGLLYATDPRLNSSFNSVFQKDNVSVGDLLLINKIKKATFTLRVIKQSDPTYIIFDDIYKQGNDRHSVYLSTEKEEVDSSVKTSPNLNPSPSSSPLLTALRTKPFVLLAGISGTGKSRIVRELARACWKSDDPEYKAHKPCNFEMIQVKPNWHDSSELIGYVSRIGEKPEFIAGDFLKFIAKAWSEPDVPHFLCLDEMNLAPVEQYFAEYLSVIESRKLEDGEIVTDPLLKKTKESYKDDDDDWYYVLINYLTSSFCKTECALAIKEHFLKEGISIPRNLFVIGTVNMDETTFSFSRKVLDRAMTIEMNEVDLSGGLQENEGNEFGYIGNSIIPQVVEGKDVYASNKELCDKVIEFLTEVNKRLGKTPFKIAYRTRNEFLVYAVCRGKDNLLNALDEMTSMKILSRIEGDSEKTSIVLDGLESLLKEYFEDHKKSVSICKIEEMKAKLGQGYTSFWS